MIVKEVDLTGKTLNNYKIVSPLGRGGMATVYKAHEKSLNRMVALKVLSTQLSEDKEYIKRFQREAQAAAQLNHPNIVQIFSIGEDKGIHYFAMEYIKGESLAEVKKDTGVMHPEKAVTLIKQVADALADAHRAGLVHRDIKPSNIMIDSLGRAKVTDFGIAYVSSAQTKLTREGSIIGTPEYLSPEQCEGKTVDQRSDIYSLGVTLYELLTGRTPYEADTPVSMLMKIVRGNFPPICEVNANLPNPLCDIIEKMMITNPDERYASMKEVLDDLNTLQLDDPIQPVAAVAKVPGTVVVDTGQVAQQATEQPEEQLVAEPVVTSHKNNRWAAFVVAAVIVLLMGGAFAAKMLIFDKDKEEVPVTETQAAVVENTSQQEDPALRDDRDSSQNEDSTAGISTTENEAGDEKSTHAAFDTKEQSESGYETSQDSVLTVETTEPPDVQQDVSSSGQSSVSSSHVKMQQGNAAVTKSNRSGGGISSAGQVTPGLTVAAQSLPPVNSCFISTLGDSDKSDVVGAYVQEILMRKNYPVIDGPSVAGKEIDSVARNHIVITARQLGTTTLNYYGNSSEQYSVSLTIKVVSPANGTIISGPISRTVKYTALNAEDNLREAVAILVTALRI
jgi:serine/threonine protein kinase